MVVHGEIEMAIRYLIISMHVQMRQVPLKTVDAHSKTPITMVLLIKTINVLMYQEQLLTMDAQKYLNQKSPKKFKKH